MAYLTGSFHSMAELHSEIEAFATDNGWTVTLGVLHKGGCAVILSTPVSQSIQVEFAASHDGAGNLIDPYPSVFYLYEVWGGPTETSNGMVMEYPATFHLFEFSASDEIICVVEYNTHYVQQMSFGTINKVGTWTGGVYGTSTAVTPYSTNPKVNNSMQFTSNYYPTGGMWGWMAWALDDYVQPGRGNAAVRCEEVPGATWVSNSYFKGSEGVPLRTPFCPVLLSQNFTSTSDPNAPVPVLSEPIITLKRTSTTYSILGSIPNIRHLNVANLEIGEVVEVGNDRWKVFPMISKLHTGHLGYAVRYEGP